MKQINKDIMLTIILVLISLVLYIIHFLIFRDMEHIMIFGISDFAFMPIEIIFVTLIFHRVLNNTEKKKKISKLYMIIETFFAEVGIELLRIFAHCDKSLVEIENVLKLSCDWNESDYKTLIKQVKNYEPHMNISGKELETVDLMFLECRPVILNLLKNPALLEHESFTELLMLLFHLAEELRLRYDFIVITELDRDHLISDVKRAYGQLAIEWLYYMKHMRIHYPHLYNLGIRNNPFNAFQEIEVKNKI